MKTQLEIKALRVLTRIGIHEWEQQIVQPILIDLTIPLDMESTVTELDEVLDYDNLCKTLSTYLENQSFRLIETLAMALVNLIQKTFGLKKMILVVHKPLAIKNASDVLFRIETD